MSESFSLEQKIKQLEEIESYFQSPNMNLDEAMAKHSQALEVAKEVLSYLKKAETTIQEIDVRGSLLSSDEMPREDQ